MLSKYHVSVQIPFRRELVAQEYRTDDPVACEEFLVDALEHGYRIVGLQHEGAAMPPEQRDRLLKTAACTVAAKRLERSLQIDEAETRHRFGLPA